MKATEPTYYPDKDVSVACVIITKLSVRGEGVVGNPMRAVVQVWTMDGELIAENDPDVGRSK